MTDAPATSRADPPAEPPEAVLDTGRDDPAEPVDLDTATRRRLATLPGRSPDPLVCPFLRAADGQAPPRLEATGLRCVATSPELVVGDRQRQLLCQAAAHATCPRHARGEAAVRAALAPRLGRRGRGGSVAIATALVLLVGAIALAVTTGLGPLGGPSGTAAPSVAEAAATATPAPPTPATGSGGTNGTPAPPATIRPTLVPTRDLPAAWRGLAACPAPDACYLYVIKRGDTLGRIATRFDTTIRALRRLNPSISDPGAIRVRQEIRVPPPPD